MTRTAESNPYIRSVAGHILVIQPSQVESGSGPNPTQPVDSPIWGPKAKTELRPFIYLNMTFKKLNIT